MKTLIALFIVSVILLIATFQSSLYRNNELKVVFRYDDYSKYSNIELEKELFRLVDSKGGGLLVGIIPFPYEPHPAAQDFSKQIFLNDEKIALLQQYHANNSIEIAAHGFNHKNNEILDYRSEFAGLPEPEQAKILNITRNKLESALGFKVTAFVPPFNNLDRNTLTALKNTGFTLLSAASATPFYQPGDINYLPGGPYPNKLRSVIDKALANNHYDALIVSTQHPYDIKESGEPMPAFRKNSVQVSLADIETDINYIASKDTIRFTSIAGLYKENENLSAERLISNMRLRTNFITQHKLLPNMIALYPQSGLYYTLASANDMYIKQIIISGCLYLAIMLITLIVSKVMFTAFNGKTWLAKTMFFTALLFILAAIAKIYLSGFYFLAALLITVSIGLGLGVAIRGNNQS